MGFWPEKPANPWNYWVYRLPTFVFKSDQKPTFFDQNVYPQKFAQILQFFGQIFLTRAHFFDQKMVIFCTHKNSFLAVFAYFLYPQKFIFDPKHRIIVPTKNNYCTHKNYVMLQYSLINRRIIADIEISFSSARVRNLPNSFRVSLTLIVTSLVLLLFGLPLLLIWVTS